MGRSEFLQVTHPSKSAHRAFSPAQGQMTVLGTIVQVATDLLAVAVSDLFHGSAI